MPDYWGRPTFQDFAQMGNAFSRVRKGIQEDEFEQEAYSVADRLSRGESISEFSPKARYTGSKMHYDSKFNEMRVKTQEHLQSEATMKDKTSRLQFNLQQANHRLQQYKSARASGDDDLAKQIALRMNNENMYTGRYVEPNEKGYTMTDWEGKKTSFDDVPMETIDHMIGSYFDKSPDDIMKWQLSAEQMRSQRNSELLSRAEPYYNDKTGRVIYKVPAGVWGPDGIPRGEFYVDDPTAMHELPASAAKGYMRMSVAEAKRKLGKKEVVDPKDIVSGTDASGASQQGLITMGVGGQPPQFQTIKGAPQQGLKTSGPPDPSKEKAAYELRMKQLKTSLMPFDTSGQPLMATDSMGNFVLTNEGKSALRKAMDLIAKANNNAASAEEQRMIPYADQAVKMFEVLNRENASAFDVNPTGQGAGNIPPPPPGAILDK